MCYNSNLLYSPDFIGAVIGALISGFFAVLLFYFGLKYDHRKEFRKRQTELTDYLNYLKTAVSNIIEKTGEQAKFIDSFIQKLNEKNFKRKELTKTQNINSTSLKAIPLLEVKKAFTLKNELGNVSFQKYVECVDSLDFLADNLMTYFQLFSKEFMRIQNMYNEGITGVQNIIEEYKKFLTINHQDVSEDPLLLFWIKIVKDWNSIDEESTHIIKTDPYITLEKLIKPLKNELPKLDLGYNATLRFHIRTCLGAIEDFEHQQKEFSEMFSKLSSGYKKLGSKLDEIKNCL
jgi:hypothetical protein